MRLSRLWIMIGLAAAACSNAPSGGQAGGAAGGDAAGGSEAVRAVRISQGSDVLSMDPYAQNEGPTFCVQRNIFDPLVDQDPQLKLIPCLATKWENTGPTTWVFHLRDGVKFQGGQPFAADDVVFSLDRAMKDPRSRMASQFPNYVSSRAIDPLTVEITTSAPDAIVPLRLAVIFMLDKESSEAGLAKDSAWLTDHANGTGPYKLAEWRKDDRCVLEANPSYWGGAPSVERLEFLATSNQATRMAGLERGEIDVMTNLPTQNVGRVENNPDYLFVQNPSLRLIYLGLDCGRDDSPGILEPAGKNPLKDPRVRRAVALGIDNGLIVKTIMAGHAEPADQLIAPGITGHDPAIQLKRPDYDEAKKLLAEAGYPNGFKLRLDGPNDRYVNDAQILQAVAQELARIGVTVVVNAQPKARFFSEERQGHCSFFLLGWTNNGDGAGTFETLLHTPDPAHDLGTDNYCTNYHNPELDKLTDAAASEFDPAKREAMLQEANQIAMQDLPQIPLHYQMDLYAVRKNVEWKPRRDTQVRGVELRWAE